MGTIEGIGNRIKKRRREIGLTQTDFLSELDLSKDSRTMVSKWENGITLPQTDMIPKICKALDCDAGYLFGEYEHPKRVASDIISETGLSENAIYTLQGIVAYLNYDGFDTVHKQAEKCELLFLSEFIENFSFYKLHNAFQRVYEMESDVDLDRMQKLSQSANGSIRLTGRDITECIKYAAYLELHKFIEDFFKNYFYGNGYDE